MMIECEKRYEQSDACTRTLGSPAFQSPEIAQGVETFSGRATDVWAAGVTLYQMVLGRTPFDADNLVDLYDQVRLQPRPQITPPRICSVLKLTISH